MVKRLILLILLCFFAKASTLKIDDKISNFSLPNQFDKIHTINDEISIIIIAFQKEDAKLVNDFLSVKRSDFLENKHAVFINNISRSSSIIVKLFTIPELRDYKYNVLLIYNENSKRFLEQEGKITVYLIKDGIVKDIRYISSQEELERVLK
jgi:hypothetical protein